jgi:putative flippase GtrA
MNNCQLLVHLVPSQAIIQEKPIPRTFAEMKKSSVHSISRKFGDDDSLQESDIVIGCGNDDDDVNASGNNNNSMQGITSSRRHNRRLQHVGGQEDCDGSSNYFCWLSCLKKPKSDHSADHHLMKGDSLYCYDPSILDTTGDLELAVKECSDPISGKAGGVMNEACANYWHPTVDGVKSYLESDDQYSQSDKKKYCYGATAMYMQGFEWEGTTCVVFLFTSWVISTRFALVVACIGTILLGILTEFITHHRRSMLKKVEERRKKVLASGALYAGQVTIGYAIMLVVMTYSGPLVISVILGLGLGHIITNWKEKKPGDNVDKSGGNVDNVNKSDDIVIEGITPCCQYLDDDKDHDSHDISRDVHNTESDRSEP